MSENFFEEEDLDNWKESGMKDEVGRMCWVGKSGSWAAALQKKRAA
jgi:hypothetical protein